MSAHVTPDCPATFSTVGNRQLIDDERKNQSEANEARTQAMRELLYLYLTDRRTATSLEDTTQQSQL
jgi:hypothetical protein